MGRLRKNQIRYIYFLGRCHDKKWHKSGGAALVARSKRERDGIANRYIYFGVWGAVLIPSEGDACMYGQNEENKKHMLAKIRRAGVADAGRCGVAMQEAEEEKGTRNGGLEIRKNTATGPRPSQWQRRKKKKQTNVECAFHSQKGAWTRRTIFIFFARRCGRLTAARRPSSRASAYCRRPS